VSFLFLPVVAAVIVAWVVLRFLRVGTFAWTLAIWLGIFLLLRFGFRVPIPGSVIGIYMGIVSIALVVYVTSSAGRWDDFLWPVDAVVNERRFRGVLAALLVLIPAAAAGNAFMASRVKLEAPAFGRTVHPAPPDSITVKGKPIDLAKGRNPFRELETKDPAAFRARVESGRKTYYQNCFFCHGDAMQGDGMFAHGLNPIPTNFTDPGTIPMLQESFLFWRISKGGPGLPAEAGPWDSAMPAWEQFLSDEQMWEVVLFLYDFTGSRPRAEGEVHH
jgi:mono/diheme cytochrome c family protein